MNAIQLKERMKRLPALYGPFERFSWKFRQQELRAAVEERHPETFLTWSTIRESMFVGNAPYIADEFIELPNRYLMTVKDKGFGGPEYFRPGLSGNYIHQMYHLWQWERVTKRRIIGLDTIVEIGGGYGAMASICYQLGFNGRYVIVDLPEFSLLQEYYLSNTPYKHNTKFAQSYEGKCDLLIACSSLSEMLTSERDKVLDGIEWKHHLITYQPEFYRVNNQEYFKKIDGIRWEDKSHWYLVR